MNAPATIEQGFYQGAGAALFALLLMGAAALVVSALESKSKRRKAGGCGCGCGGHK